MNLQNEMLQELEEKKIFEEATRYAFDYIDKLKDGSVFPNEANLSNLEKFDIPLQNESANPLELLEKLHQYGSPNTVLNNSGRYFGFIIGGALPITQAAKWLTDIWDQVGGLYVTSPINAKIEEVCQKWLVDLFNLPKETVAGFTSGGIMANFSGLIAARYRLLKNLGWDINSKGLNGAPALKIVTHKHIHAAIKKSLAMLGYGYDNITWIDCDQEGRMLVESLPEIDSSTLIILCAGSANSGCFDDFESIIKKANDKGAWVHVDGAFGMWAAVSSSLSYLTKGMEKANSWAVDGHKALNTPYDSGVVLCKDEEALTAAFQASAGYIIYTDKKRDPFNYTPEFSKKSRALEMWVALYYLGKQGLDDLITMFHERTLQLKSGLEDIGFEVVNEVKYNQLMIRYKDDDSTNKILEQVQQSGKCWCGGSVWHGERVIRLSVCSWATTEEDIKITIAAFKDGLNVTTVKTMG